MSIESVMLTISSSVTLFSLYVPSSLASGPFPKSRLFTSGGQSTGASARRSSQSILQEINPECSLEGLVLKLKLQYLESNMYAVTLLHQELLED